MGIDIRCSLGVNHTAFGLPQLRALYGGVLMRGIHRTTEKYVGRSATGAERPVLISSL